MSSSPPSPWPVRKLQLSPPPLAELVPAIRSGLQSNFASVSVEVSASPDLRDAPYHLAGPGLSGHTRVGDVGGPPYLAPGPDFTKKYDLLSISQQMEMSPDRGFLVGAGAGPFHVLGLNSELVPNLSYGAAATENETASAGTKLNNQTHYVKITENGGYSCQKIGHQNDNTTAFGLMANLFGSDGLPGDLLHIKAKSRTGPLNFTEAIQDSIKAAYGDRLISLGGVFIIHRGTAYMHVMPDFPKDLLPARERVESWLKYFNMAAPMICLSVLHSGDDQGLGLRMEHTHCFSVEGGGGRGGHYHFDLDETKDEIEYDAWFNVAETLYRIDQPGSS